MITVTIDKAKKLGCQYSMFLRFPYDYEIVEVMRSFPQRNWDKVKKEWELPLEKLSKLIDQLPNQEFDISGEYVDMTPKTDVPDGFQFKTEPFKHQLDGFAFGLGKNRWFLGDEQGLGKTKQVIDIAVAKRLQYGYKHCLIICGVNGLKYNWQNEVKTHSFEESWILGSRYNTRTRKWSIGGNKDKLADLVNIKDISQYFLITNVETLRDKEIAERIQKLCENKTIGVVAIDEIHKCKNPSSQQGKGILKIQSDCRIAMTGTPLMNSPLDLYVILKWLGYENHNYYAFKNHYCKMGGYGGYEIVGYQNLGELQERLDEIMLRRLKKDVLDLPAKLYIDEFVEMSSDQGKIYNEVYFDIQENIDKIKAAPNPLAQLMRLRQATGYTGILSSTIKESAKLDRMEELVDEAIANGQQVVVFSNWTQMTDAAWARLCKKYICSIITGQTLDVDRQSNVQAFQSGTSKVMIGTIGAMGTGLTLTAGTVEIFLDEPWTRAAKEQAEDRCHRVGTSENVTIYTLMCKGTIDEKIHDLILEKGEMADALIDKQLNSPMGRDVMLNYLLN